MAHTPVKRRNNNGLYPLRLFDPARPRGLIETHTIIPLNDEYLKAFGTTAKRTRNKRVNLHPIRKDMIDPSSDAADTLPFQQQQQQQQEISEEQDENIESNQEQPQRKRVHGTVGIVNIAYTTTIETIFKTCER